MKSLDGYFFLVFYLSGEPAMGCLAADIGRAVSHLPVFQILSRNI